MIETCFSASSVCPKHAHSLARSEGKGCLSPQCPGLFVTEGTLPVREVRRVAPRDTQPLKMSPHMTNTLQIYLAALDLTP